jgi:hypothetical protein
VGSTYVPNGSNDDDVLSDISVAGYCRAHREAVVPEVRRLVEAKGTILFFMDPPVALRTDEIEPFLLYMASGLR